MPLYNINAIVLKRADFGETDRILTLLSKERGKTAAIAKGSRKPISRLSGATESIIYVRYQLAAGMNLDVVTQAEIKESFPRIHSDLFRIAYASYLAEMMDQFTDRDQVNPETFELLLSSLYLLERLNDPEVVARMFDLQLMKELGYEPVIDRCVKCGKPLNSGDAVFSSSAGGMVCPNCMPHPADAISLSEEAIALIGQLLNADAHSIERIKASRGVIDEITRALGRYVRFRSDYDLKSVRFLQTLKLGKHNEEPNNS